MTTGILPMEYFLRSSQTRNEAVFRWINYVGFAVRLYAWLGAPDSDVGFTATHGATPPGELCIRPRVRISSSDP